MSYCFFDSWGIIVFIVLWILLLHSFNGSNNLLLLQSSGVDDSGSGGNQKSQTDQLHIAPAGLRLIHITTTHPNMTCCRLVTDFLVTS